MHTPPVQVPAPLLHMVPSGRVGFEQPLAGSHVPAEWQSSMAVHVTGVPGVQAPDWHVSFIVQALPSLHEVPFVAFGVEHMPVVGSHVPAAWQVAGGGQVTAVPGVQAPA